MPFPPAVARAIAKAGLKREEVERLEELHYADAGHGFDSFGMHSDYVAAGSAIAAPLYNQYFRVQSHDAHHIPAHGPGILAANHSGTMPTDGMMIWADVVRQTNPPRVVRAIADHFVPALPVVGTLFARNGVVGGSRGNVRSLLRDDQILLIFPEGTPGIVKPYRDRYRLKRFRVGHVEFAIRFEVPIIPVGVVGAEEQAPQLANSRRLGKMLGLPSLPILALPLPLPVKIHLYYGEPIHFDHSPEDADNPVVLREAAARTQAAVQALVDKGLRERDGVFV